MRRHGKWAAAALALFALAAWLMLRSEGEPLLRPERVVELPRSFSPLDHARMQRRQTLPPVPKVAGVTPPARPRDPLLAALAVPKGKSVVVIEANAIRNSPLGELLIRCLTQQQGGADPFAEMKKQNGVDLLQDLDRVAVTDHGIVLSGNFKNARWDALPQATSTAAYGEQGSLVSTAASDGHPTGTIGRWKDQLLYFGPDADGAREAIDRIEGRAPTAAALDESQTYGEIYGVLSSADLARMLPADPSGLADRIRSVAEQVELHVDASHDVGMVATLRGPNASDVEDLGKSLGALLSVGRMKAQATGDTDLAELLEFAKVAPRAGAFNLELALPLAVLEKHLSACRPPPQAPTRATMNAGAAP